MSILAVFEIVILASLAMQANAHGLMGEPMQRLYGDNVNGLHGNVCGGPDSLEAGPIVRTYRSGQTITIYSNVNTNKFYRIFYMLNNFILNKLKKAHCQPSWNNCDESLSQSCEANPSV